MLNYTPKALECLDRLRLFFQEHLPEDVAVHRWCTQVLQRSMKFHLPDDGLVFGESAEISYPDLMRGQHRLPFPAVAIEMQLNPGTYPVFDGAIHPTFRRLAVAVDLQNEAERKAAREAFGLCFDVGLDRLDLDPQSPAACLLFSLDYSSLNEPHMDVMREILAGVGEAWMPSWCGVLLPYDQRMRDRKPTCIEETILTPGRLVRNAVILMEPVPYGRAGVMKIEEAGGDYNQLHQHLGEFVLESGSLLSLLIALSCRNVRMVANPPSEKLQRARARRGQRPLYEYKTLEFLAHERCRNLVDGNSGVRASPYEHLRRGHVRRLPTGETTWVSNSVVNPGHPGKIVKTYRVKAG